MTTSPQDDAVRPAPIDCEVAVRRLWDYLDGRLPEIARAEVEAHLESCAHCPPHFDFARTMQRALAASAPSAPDSAEDLLRERVRAALRRLADDSR
jgi:anti-sigma factor (TIGR02949 family)